MEKRENPTDNQPLSDEWKPQSRMDELNFSYLKAKDAVQKELSEVFDATAVSLDQLADMGKQIVTPRSVKGFLGRMMAGAAFVAHHWLTKTPDFEQTTRDLIENVDINPKVINADMSDTLSARDQKLVQFAVNQALLDGAESPDNTGQFLSEEDQQKYLHDVKVFGDVWATLQPGDTFINSQDMDGSPKQYKIMKATYSDDGLSFMTASGFKGLYLQEVGEDQQVVENGDALLVFPGASLSQLDGGDGEAIASGIFMHVHDQPEDARKFVEELIESELLKDQHVKILAHSLGGQSAVLGTVMLNSAKAQEAGIVLDGTTLIDTFASKTMLDKLTLEEVKMRYLQGEEDVDHIKILSDMSKDITSISIYPQTLATNTNMVFGAETTIQKSVGKNIRLVVTDPSDIEKVIESGVYGERQVPIKETIVDAKDFFADHHMLDNLYQNVLEGKYLVVEGPKEDQRLSFEGEYTSYAEYIFDRFQTKIISSIAEAEQFKNSLKNLEGSEGFLDIRREYLDALEKLDTTKSEFLPEVPDIISINKKYMEALEEKQTIPDELPPVEKEVDTVLKSRDPKDDQPEPESPQNPIKGTLTGFVGRVKEERRQRDRENEEPNQGMNI